MFAGVRSTGGSIGSANRLNKSTGAAASVSRASISRAQSWNSSTVAFAPSPSRMRPLVKANARLRSWSRPLARVIMFNCSPMNTPDRSKDRALWLRLRTAPGPRSVFFRNSWVILLSMPRGNRDRRSLALTRPPIPFGSSSQRPALSSKEQPTAPMRIDRDLEGRHVKQGFREKRRGPSVESQVKLHRPSSTAPCQRSTGPHHHQRRLHLALKIIQVEVGVGFEDYPADKGTRSSSARSGSPKPPAKLPST